MADAAAHPEERTPAPFIVGVGRSGTTLLRLMLDAHPALAIPPETGFLPELRTASEEGRDSQAQLVDVIASHWRWGDYGLERDDVLERAERHREAGEKCVPAALRGFYEAYAAREGKPRWGDKTPAYVRRLRHIHHALPEARFIHIYRDGRDVSLSRVNTLALTDDVTMAKAARIWKRSIRRARRQGEKLGPELYTEVRYESLVADPEPELRRICEHVRLDFDPAMLDYHERSADRLAELDRDLPSRGAKPTRSAESRMAMHEAATRPPDEAMLGKWRREMSADDLATFERIAGEVLTELGYPLSDAG
ncbi:sulfotransferase [Thermoleophilia bacterium SCSIO 60948]|nr:sulfotransferase [Thermoleophilia bacterium SCSIO 60948]